MFPLVHLWVRAAAAVELYWEAQQVSDGPGPDPDDVRQPQPGSLLFSTNLESSFQKPGEVVGFIFFFLRVLQELMGLPGVSKVGWSSWGFAGDPELVPW